VLLESGKHSDVVLQVNGKEFPAHKCILSARSKVFEEMLHSSDNDVSKVDILGVEPTVFECLLRYIYSGTIPPKGELASQELFSAADMVCCHECVLVLQLTFFFRFSTNCITSNPSVPNL